MESQHNKDLLDSVSKELRQGKQRFSQLLGHLIEGVIVVNLDFIIEDINPIAESLCDCQKTFCVGKPLADCISLMDPDSDDPVAFTVENALAQTQVGSHILLTRLKHQRLVRSFFCPLREDNGEIFSFLFILRDIDSRFVAQGSSLWQESHDNITGLVNYSEFSKRLQQSLDNAKSYQQVGVLLLIDIDQLDNVKLSFGIEEQKRCIQGLSVDIIQLLRGRDTLARMGNDEFGLLLENCLLDDAISVAEKIIDAVANHYFYINEQSYNLTASVGIVAITKDVARVKDLISAAATACNNAQANGGNCVRLHSGDNLHLKSQRDHLLTVDAIDKALEQDWFTLNFQPIYSTSAKKVCHWEALLRFQPEADVVITQETILPFAEKYGLINRIDTWVFNHAVETLVRLKQTTGQNITLAVNISPQSLEDNLCQINMLNALREHPEVGQHLIIEIIETALLDNIESLNVFLHELKLMGCRLALDDFGTGVSSYAYVRRLDIDMIKIDGEFIQQLTDNKINQEIVGSLSRVAKLIGVTTTAEWVDSKTVLDYLTDQGIDYCQGEFISPAVGEAQLIESLNQGQVNHWPIT